MSIAQRALPYVLASIVVMVVCLGFYRAGYQAADTAWQSEWATAQANAESNARAQEQAMHDTIQEVRADAHEQIRQATADAATANAAADSLHQHAERLARKAAECSSPTTGSAAANTPGMVLANVLARADKAAGELAAAYDHARIAGLSCERAYDGVGKDRAK